MRRSISEIPEAADFLAHLRLKNLAQGTIAEYRKVMRYLFDHLQMSQQSPTEITTASCEATLLIFRSVDYRTRRLVTVS